MDTDSMINATVCFSSQQPGTTHFTSNCRTNLKGADAEITREMAHLQTQTQTNLAQRGLTWSFIFPHTPHYGGIWECMVQDSKSMRECVHPSVRWFICRSRFRKNSFFDDFWALLPLPNRTLLKLLRIRPCYWTSPCIRGTGISCHPASKPSNSFPIEGKRDMVR